jgi:hypothetical protein
MPDLLVSVEFHRDSPQGRRGQGQVEGGAGVADIEGNRPCGGRSGKAPIAPDLPAEEFFPLPVRRIGTGGIKTAVFLNLRPQPPADGNTGPGIQGIQGNGDFRISLRQGGDKETPYGMGFGRGNPDGS